MNKRRIIALLIGLSGILGCSLFFFHKHKIAKFDRETKLVVVIPSYNNAKWYKKNLDSILEQVDASFRVIYINDCSKDSTGERVEKYLKEKGFNYRVINFDDHENPDLEAITKQFAQEIGQEPSFFILVNNRNRCGALQNLYRAIHSCEDKEIVATIDGDDWMAHKKVFKQIKQAYATKNIWLTHGKLKHYPDNFSNWCEPVPQNLIKENAFRNFKCPSHLRTFYAWLFKKIKLEDLLYEGKFYWMTWDMAMMYPMIEMAGHRHAFINDVNYIYNMVNEINDNKVNAELQRFLDTHIRSLPPYERIE